MSTAARAGAALLVAAVAGCTATTGTTDPSVAKYEQTWPKSYAHTTCDEFENTMTPQQRFAAAADMLTGARSRDGGTDVPSDALINEFKAAIDKSCPLIPTDSLTDVAVSEYLVDRAIFRP